MKQWLTLLDAYFSVCLGCDIRAVVPGETRVSASSRREKRELHYADVFPVWCFVTQNRCVVSVQRPLLGAVSRLVSGWGTIGDGNRFRAPAAREPYSVNRSP